MMSVKQAAGTTAAALLALYLAGCQLSVAGVSQPAANDGLAALQPADPVQQSDSPQKSYHKKDNSSAISVKGSTADDGAATIPNATTESSANATDNHGKQAPPAANATADEAWNAKSPRLIGLALGQPIIEATAKLGKPIDTYPLQDGTDKLIVDEYASYAVGYGSDKTIVFIEVFDKSAKTGLNGLRVGDNGNAAVKALGKPNSRTSSVIAYEAAGVMLKLDLDPQNGRIISIKLFSADRQP